MRRIVVAVMSTLSGLVLLFAYPTSHGTALATARPTPSEDPTAGTTGGTSGSADTPSSGTPATSSSPSTSSSGTPEATPATTTPSGSAGSASSRGLEDGTFTGDSTDTRWGPVQVEITVSGGKVTQARAVVYPDGNGRDQEINAYALPILAQEAVSAQSAQIDAVSGATVTSDGYVTSLQSALDRAHA